jgi:hypothetical protein
MGGKGAYRMVQNVALKVDSMTPAWQDEAMLTKDAC